jgi:ubiquinone/menaquinone biosynthesis C-methylase UbiE
MTTPASDKKFTGSVPQLYEELLVPLIFVPYARDLASRAQQRAISALLEVAAGTGAATRELAERLPASTSIVATDLNQPMLDQAARSGTPRPVRWQQADAMQLPFADASFDAVVCQFGVMFFPDRAPAYAQVRRVLRPGGAFIFNTWDRIEANEFADTVQSALLELYPDDPPRFLARTPYGYFDAAGIRDDLARAGFREPATITILSARSRAGSARVVAQAFCQGTPLRAELDARGPGQLARATDAAQAALERRFGAGALEAAISALVVEVVA